MRPYQLEGAQWLHDYSYPMRGRLLADGLGTGKTRTALADIRLSFEKGLLEHPVVLGFTTANSVFDWQREAARFWPELKVVRMDSGKVIAKRKSETKEQFEQRKLEAKQNAEWKKALKEASSPTLIIGDYWWSDVAETEVMELGLILDKVLLDEAHNVKNAGTRRENAVHKHVARAKYTTLLTGTPVHDRAIDMHNLLRLMNARFKQSRYSWAAQYYHMETTDLGYTRIGSLKDKDALVEDLKPYVLGRSAQELMGKDLPARTHQLKLIDVPGATRMSPAKLRVKARDSAAIEELMREMVRHKFDAAMQLIEDIAKPIVVFLYKREDARLFHAKLEANKLTATLATGDQTPKARDAAIERWKLGESQALVCTMDAVKESATLVRADVMLFVDLTVMPATVLQNQGRIDPARQPENERRPVTYLYLVVRNGPDEVVAETLIEKLQEASGVGVKNGNADAFADFLKPLDKRQDIAKALDPDTVMEELVHRLNVRADRLADLGML